MKRRILATACLVTLLITALATQGCGGGGGARVRSPADVVIAYCAALEAGRHADAYSYMSAGFRSRHTLANFTKMIKADPRGAAAFLAQLRRQSDKLRVEARVNYGDGQYLKLAVDQGEWRIASDPTDLYSQLTPAEALNSFVRALELGRYDIVLRFVPNKSLKGLTVAKLKKAWGEDRKSEMVTLIRNLKANLDAPIHQDEDRATMAYGDGFEMKMVREDGVWKVVDPG